MNSKCTERYSEILKSKQLILLTVAGSALLGLESQEQSDRDEIGIYVEDMREIAGFGNEQHVVWRSAEMRTGRVGEKSQPGDVDLTLYGLRKFLRLALGGNPTILNVLYAPKTSCSVFDGFGASLQDLAPSLVSKRAGNAFLGYLNQQRLRLVGERGQMRVHRPELVNEFGYDTKYAMHVLRLGYQGSELLKSGKLSIPLLPEAADYLIKVKQGSLSLNEVLSECEYLEDNIKRLMDTSTLPGSPDFSKVEEWLLNVYKYFWK